MGAIDAAADGPNPQPLWQAYPIEGGGARGDSGSATRPSTTPAPKRPTTATTTASQHLSAGDGPPWLLIAAVAAGGVAFVVALSLLYGRAVEGERRGAAAANGRERRAPPARAPSEVGANGAPPAFDIEQLVRVPRRRFERPPQSVQTPQARAAAARRGPICQVRWSPAAQCFYAVTTDADGVEHRLAHSPRVDWHDAAPPDDENRAAQTALRVLSKQLRDDGWRPMRIKGTDFGAQRWYARRFRFPVAEGDDERTPWLSDGAGAAAPRHEATPRR